MIDRDFAARFPALYGMATALSKLDARYLDDIASFDIFANANIGCLDAPYVMPAGSVYSLRPGIGDAVPSIRTSYRNDL